MKSHFSSTKDLELFLLSPSNLINFIYGIMATSQVCRTYGEYRRLMGRLKEEDEAKERLPDVSCLRPVLEPIRKLSQE